MNSYIKKLIKWNNENQRSIVPIERRNSDWRYQIMELSETELKSELLNWSREKMIVWLNWNDPNGIWTDEDSIAEGMKPLTKENAYNYIYKLLIE